MSDSTGTYLYKSRAKSGWVDAMEDARRTVVGIRERLADADVLWLAGRRESALLLALIAMAARARLESPGLRDRDAFIAYAESRHDWRISAEHRGKQVPMDELLYRWLRCSLVHEATLPVDIALDSDVLPLGSLSVRAGGAPSYQVLLGTDWYGFVYSSALEGLPSI